MSRKWYSLLLIGALAVVTFGVACKDDTESPEESSFETLTMYMAANDMDLDDVLDGWITSAADIVDNLDDYYIMDIRSAEDYALGHLPGAVHSSLGNIVSDAAANTNNDPIVVVCYTGQSAGHAVVALRLSGYSDAMVLKFGMSGWHSDFDRWTTNCASVAVGDANWTTDPVAANQNFDYPDWSSTETDGAAILADRVDALLDGGFKGVNGVDVLGTPGDYFINNYWAQSDVDQYGHIVGAYRIKEDLTIDLDGLMHLDPSETVVTYCWTGQTSSIVTAYLTVLGYDATSLKFGVNSLIYDELEGHQWTGSADYAYETGGPSATPYETLTDYLSDNDMDLDDILDGWIIAAADIVDNLDDYYIMDIRSDDDYALGHVPGAVHSSLGSIVTDAAGNTDGDPIVVVCYTGQSAGHAVTALRLSGYPDAMVLKFGMSSWHSDFDRWSTNTANIAVGHANWTTDPVAATEDFSDPTLTASATDGAGILAERVDALLAGGFKGVNGADALDAPGDYFINNYWAQTDVDQYGHIVGAYRIKEDLTIDLDGLMHLDPSETVVTYCWTGQTSSMVTAYLTVLGFDASSLKFGVNSLIYDELEGHQWTGSADYDYETG